jgi:hypothetical protein
MKRENIKDCPKDASHILLNPAKEFIQLFYRKNKYGIWQYLSTCGGGWFATEDKNIENKLTEIN